MFCSRVTFVLLFSVAFAQTELENSVNNTAASLSYSGCGFVDTVETFIESYVVIKEELQQSNLIGYAHDMANRFHSESKTLETSLKEINVRVKEQQQTCLVAAKEKGKGSALCNLKAGFKYAYKYVVALFNYTVRVAKIFVDYRFVLVQKALRTLVETIKQQVNKIAETVRNTIKCMKTLFGSRTYLAIEGQA